MTEAVATPTSSMLLQEQLKRLSSEALIACLDEWFGYKPEGEMTKEELAEKLLLLQADRVAAAQKANLEAAQSVASDDDPVVRIRFQNLDAPGVPLEFTYAGPKGFKTRIVNSTVKVEPAPTFVLMHNEEADVPLSVYEHLNGLRVPESQFEMDEHGFVRGISNGYRNRFACQLVLTPEQKKRLGMG